MPIENIWEDFFNVELILSELHINSKINNLAEIGCGYGTFTIPAAEQIRGKLYAFDIEKEMCDMVKHKTLNASLYNVKPEHRDVLAQTTGLKENSMDYVMIFNILHHDSPLDFFNEAYRILKPQGKVGILHWRSDIPTPRGPELSIRPKPDQVLQWIDRLKFNIDKGPVIFEPYHYGLLISRK